MKKFIIVLLLCLNVNWCNAQSIKVYHVKNGDTFTGYVESTGQVITVRLTQIDAPERGCFRYEESRDYLKLLIQNKSVKLIIHGKDKYDRTLADVYINNIYVNKTMVEKGLAFVFSTYCTDNSFYTAQYLAKIACIGVWTQKNIIYPWTYKAVNYKKA